MDSDVQHSFIPLGTIQIPLDKELVSLLNETHYALGVLDGMLRYMPHAVNLKELLQLRECYISTTIGVRKRLTFPDALKAFTVNSDSSKQITNLANALTKYSGKELSIKTLTPIYNSVCGLPEDSCQSPFRKDDNTELIEFRTRYSNQKEIAALAEDTLEYLQRNNAVDILIKIALVYYQFMTLKPFEENNAVIARLLIHLGLATQFRICASILNVSDFIKSDFVEHNQKLWDVRSNHTFAVWVCYFVKAIRESANRIRLILADYENVVFIDTDTIERHSAKSKAVVKVYDYFKQYPISEIQPICVHTGLSFNTVSKAIQILQELKILEQEQEQSRHRVFFYVALLEMLHIS